MRVVRPTDIREFKRVIEDARKSNLLVYISAYPCPECEIFESSLEELGIGSSDRIVKVDVPAEDWAVEYVVNELGIPGAPVVILPDGKVLDDFDPVELALKVKSIVEKAV